MYSKYQAASGLATFFIIVIVVLGMQIVGSAIGFDLMGAAAAALGK